MKFQRILVFAIGAFLMTGPALHARAQATPQAPSEKTDETPADGYMPATLPNISKLYWAVGKLRIDDNTAIDHYMRINECDIYTKYFHDDFEWSDIRKAAREDILQKHASFPTHFEVTVPLEVGRYNDETKRFELAPESKHAGTRNIEVVANKNNEDVCGTEAEIEGYPRNIILVLNRPVFLVDIPVEPDVARLYLERSRKNYEGLPPDQQLAAYKRTAFLRLKVKATQYRDTVRGRSGAALAAILANYDGYEIYADSSREMLLYSYSTAPQAALKPKSAVAESLPAAENLDAQGAGQPQ